MLNGLQKVIADRLIKSAGNSREGIIEVFPEILFDAVNYHIAEGHTFNCKRADGTYLHQIRFMGFKFQAVSAHPVYNSEEFFKERPAR